MPRKPTPARVKRSNADGTCLYAWRDAPGLPERTGKGPGGKANLLKFQSHVQECWDKGQVPSAPKVVLGEPGSPSSVLTPPTFAEWLGTPEKPGRFFEHTRGPITDERRTRYFEEARLHGAMRIIGKKRLDLITQTDAEAVMDFILSCPECLKRAKKAGRPITEKEARADRYNPDCPNHLPARLQHRDSVRNVKGSFSALFNGAIRAGVITTINPFNGRNIGYWDEPPSNDEWRLALTVDQLQKLVEAHPDELKVVPVVSTFAMLRAGEMWGLQRRDFPVPPENPEQDPSSITFNIERVWRRTARQFSKKGKTLGSTGELSALGARGAKVVNDHLRRNHLPNEACPACQEGKGLWRDAGTNPHLSCGWADDAPLVPVTMCDPSKYSSSVSKRAQAAAGLKHLPFEITHRSFRSTGATMHLVAGTPLAVVVAMGRWTNDKMLRQTYMRLYNEAYTDAVAAMERYVDAELGVDCTEDAPVDARLRFLERRVATLEADNAELIAENEQLRAGLGLPERQRKSVIQPALIDGRRNGKWSLITDDRLRNLLTTCESQVEILRALNLSSTPTNYEKLRQRIERLGLELPKAWVKNAMARISDDAIRAAVAEGETQEEVLERLGLSDHPRQFVRLAERARKLGLELPAKNQRQRRRGA